MSMLTMLTGVEAPLRIGSDMNEWLRHLLPFFDPMLSASHFIFGRF